MIVKEKFYPLKNCVLCEKEYCIRNGFLQEASVMYKNICIPCALKKSTGYISNKLKIKRGKL